MVRAKFLVTNIERVHAQPEQCNLTLRPVYKTGDAESENSKFWKYTPSGEIKLTCVNPEAVAEFELGKEYYIDFTAVE